MFFKRVIALVMCALMVSPTAFAQTLVASASGNPNVSPAPRSQTEEQALGVPISKQEIGTPASVANDVLVVAAASKKPKDSTESVARGEPVESAASEYPPLLIGPGDHLTIMVLGYEHNVSANTDFSTGGKSNLSSNLPTEYMVDTDGHILFPFVGVIKLSGMSPIEAGTLLMKKLVPYMKYPQVTVLITQTNTYSISVLGDVVKPGQYMIQGKPNLVSMVALAGGPLPEADLGGVLITHGPDKIKADLGHLLNDKNYHGAGPTVYPGDIIYVPKSGWPSLGEWAIVASILASAAIVAVEIPSIRNH